MFDAVAVLAVAPVAEEAPVVGRRAVLTPKVDRVAAPEPAPPERSGNHLT